MKSIDLFHEALQAYGRQDYAGALAHVQQAQQQSPDCWVYAEAGKYLDRVQREGKSNVYVSPEAFGAFIRGGGNVPLYENTSAALKRVYEQYDSLSLLDVGAGDGLALLPALTHAKARIRHLDVLEPSLAMLNHASDELNRRNIEHRAINATIQQFMVASPGKYDVIESTYAMQSLRPEDRPQVLSWLKRHSARVLIVEFDAPDFAEIYDPQRVQYFIERYERGLAEYTDDGGLVAQGFLMPVFFGGFDPGEARVNWEMPIAEWVRHLRGAGFTEVRTESIYDYWWAPAFLIDAQ
jgi:SAM-dependent methyltransferase